MIKHSLSVKLWIDTRFNKNTLTLTQMVETNEYISSNKKSTIKSKPFEAKK